MAMYYGHIMLYFQIIFFSNQGFTTEFSNNIYPSEMNLTLKTPSNYNSLGKPSLHDTRNDIWIVGKPSVVQSVAQLIMSEILFIIEQSHCLLFNRMFHFIEQFFFDLVMLLSPAFSGLHALLWSVTEIFIQGHVHGGIQIFNT